LHGIKELRYSASFGLGDVMGMRGHLVAFVFLCGLVSLGGPAGAQTQQQVDWCQGKDGATPDLQIGGCTAVIQSGRAIGKNLAIVLTFRAMAYHVKGDYDRAIADGDQAVRLDPKCDACFVNRGAAYIGKGDFDRAIANYDQAIRLNPKFDLAFIDRGVAYHAKHDYDRAIANFDQAIKLRSPKSAFVFKDRGDAYDAKGDYDRAIADCDQAIKLDPKYASAFTSRGLAWEHKGNRDRAIADYTEANRLNPNDADAIKALKRLKQ
jgi:tetratricopeptide (TPR) repeat protein